MYKIIFPLILFLLIAFGCRVNENEVSISVKNLQDAKNGKAQMVDFEAQINVPLTMDNITQKFQLEKVKGILNEYLELDDYEIEKGDIIGTRIEIEGKLPLLLAQGVDSVKAPTTSAWAIVLVPIPKEPKTLFSKYDYIVSLATTETFLEMNKKLQSINFMLGVEPTQPLKVKLKNKLGKSLDIFAGPIEVDGTMKQYYEQSFNKGKLRFEMKQGIYNYIQPSFMVKFSY
jgi:hypothetical protein